jgi:tetratricopeptide (TPR) repeat protein
MHARARAAVKATQVRIMISGNRSILTMWLALIASVCITAPSSAQKSDATARSAQIAELSRAGKYSEAIPLAQRLLADMEKAYGPVHRDVAASLNNLALLYGDQGRDADAEPLYKRALAIQEKVYGLDSSEVAPELNNLAALYQRRCSVISTTLHLPAMPIRRSGVRLR